MKKFQQWALVIVVVTGLLGVAWVVDTNLEERRCWARVAGLATQEGAGPEAQTTLGQFLQERHLNGNWHVQEQESGKDAVFEAGETRYRWHCTSDAIPFITAVNSGAQALTPHRLSLAERLRRSKKMIEDEIDSGESL